MSVKGKGARRKGSRAEIRVRNMLRTIYPPELRNNVQRVPLSGAGAIKCDVMDTNDPDSAYEVKCQETLNIGDWWKQAKFQAGVSRTPILVINQAYRPFYFMMKHHVWSEMIKAAGYDEINSERALKSTRSLMDVLAELETHEVATIEIGGDKCVFVSQTYYLEVKKSLFLDSQNKT